MMNKAFQEYLDELNNYHHSKTELNEMYVQSRLNQSLKTYSQMITESNNYLQYNHDPLKSLKHLGERDE